MFFNEVNFQCVTTQIANTRYVLSVHNRRQKSFNKQIMNKLTVNLQFTFVVQEHRCTSNYVYSIIHNIRKQESTKLLRLRISAVMLTGKSDATLDK